MERSFPDTLSALRREKNLSQRAVAADLNISQALLSHYEKGTREPGLGFVCRVCDYYGVTADYILCRSEDRSGGIYANGTAKAFLEQLKAYINKAEMILDEMDGEKP